MFMSPPVKSSWICWLIAVSLLAGLPSAAAERDKRRSPGELVNVFLAPGNAQWLVGPIALMASEEEIETYLAITDDEICSMMDGSVVRAHQDSSGGDGG